MAPTAALALALLLAMAASLTFHAHPASGTPSESVATDCAGTELAHWSFDGTFDDVSPKQRGEAIPAWDRAPVGGNIYLAWDAASTCAGAPGKGHVHIGNPGYLEVPAVDLHNISFAISFTVRVNGQLAADKVRALFTSYIPDTPVFLMLLKADRRVSVNIYNKAAVPLVTFSSTVLLPLGTWTTVELAWDRSARTGTLYIDGVKAGSQLPWPQLKDVDVQVPQGYYYQFGAYDVASGKLRYEPVNSDLRDLRVVQKPGGSKAGGQVHQADS